MCRTIILLCAVCACAGSRILLVFPAPARSHAILGDSLADIFLSAGHEVTYVTQLPKENENPALKIINVSSLLEQIPDDQHLVVSKLVRNPRPLHKIFKVGSQVNARLMKHEAVQNLLMDVGVSFDVVVADWFYSGLLAPLAAVYNCPLIWYNAADASWVSMDLIHEASSAAYSVDLRTRNLPAVPYTILERAYQLGVQLYMSAWRYYITNFEEIPLYKDIYEKALQVRGRQLPSYNSLIYNGSFQLINSYPPLAQRIPLPQNARHVGGHHIETPPKPLTKNLQVLLDNAKHGVIFFSMGSNLKSKDFPEYMKREVIEMFGQLNQTILWKFEEDLADLPSNVHIFDWAPQRSILEHPNTVLLITHGGLLSVMEATHYAVPLIGIPLFADQFVNVDTAQALGIGLRVDCTERLPSKMKEAIHKILGDRSYRLNVQHASVQFRNRLISARREVAHWVQLAIATGGAPHLRSPALRLSAVDKLHLDLVALAAAALWLLWLLSRALRDYRVRAGATTSDPGKKVD